VSSDITEHSFYSRRQRRKIVMLVLLLLVLAVLAYTALYFSQHRRLPIPGINTAAQLEPPNYLFSITASGISSSIPKPTGVAVSQDRRVFVSVPQLGVIRVFNASGKYLYSFSAVNDGARKALTRPVHIAIDHDSELWVADRDNEAIYVFSLEGKYIRRFIPKGGEPQWAPLAIAFDDDGYLYVSDVRSTNHHRIFVFDPSGKRTALFGRTQAVTTAEEAPGAFFFPNGFAIDHQGQVYVADGDNRRVQVFDRQGKFKRFLRTTGVPRGLSTDAKSRLYVVDALGHTVDIFSPVGDKLVEFGGPGVGPGQFQYPNDISLDRNGRIYIIDRDNNQVQVWGWPSAGLPAPRVPASPASWGLLAIPLLLLLLPFLLRKRTLVLLPDFATALVAEERARALVNRRWRWITPEAEHELLRGIHSDGVDLAELVRPEVHSDSDAVDLKERLALDDRTAIILVVAKRAKALFTEDSEIARLATLLGVDVYNHEQFLERFAKKK